MDYKDLARRFRLFIESMSANATDEEALSNIEAFPLWKVGLVITQDDVNKGLRLRYENKLYKVIQPHTTQADWTPDKAVSLFVKVSLDEFPEWVQPTGAHDAYEKGSKVSHLQKHWISTYDGANVWEPSVFGWEEV